MKSRRPQKPKTSLGPTRLGIGPDGGQTAEYIADRIPTDKEGRERYFAEKFIEAFNHQKPLGTDVKIGGFDQKDTSDLDFAIACSSADYLELAAIKPLSEEFGKDIARSGNIDVLQLSEWIYENLIGKKASRYGELAARTFLLLYPEDWQFLLSDSIVNCLAALCKKRGTTFAGIFTVMAGPPGLVILHVIAPGDAVLPDPESYAGRPLQNFEPGKSEHKFDLS